MVGGLLSVSISDWNTRCNYVKAVWAGPNHSSPVTGLPRISPAQFTLKQENLERYSQDRCCVLQEHLLVYMR